MTDPAKAGRRAAALKGWETRRACAGYRNSGSWPPAQIRVMSTHDIGCWWCRFEDDGVLETYHHGFMKRFAMPVPARVRGWWPRIVGWFR